MAPPNPSSRAAIDKDAADLKRGVGINVVGHVLKLANPVLLVLVTSTYGAKAYGAFIVAEAAIAFAARAGAMGLDKALLWWVARADPSRRRTHVGSTVSLATALTAVLSLVMFVLADPDVLRRVGQSPELCVPLRIMAFAMVPQVATEVLTHAVMGMRRMEAHVVVKDAVIPATFPVGALLLHSVLGLRETGLPVAYAVATTLGMFVAMWMYRAQFSGMEGVDSSSCLPPRALVRYAIPMWMTEVTNSMLQRLDVLLVDALTGDLGLVGAYGVAVKFSNAIRQIRRSFDPIVVAIAADIGAQGDRHRLRAGFSYATFLVTLTQIPIFPVVFAFAEEIVGLYGEGFEAATVPVVILSVVWMLNGLLSLAGVVVVAYGGTTQALIAVWTALLLLFGAGRLLIPRYELVGAALAVGVAYVGQGLVEVAQMWQVTGGWNYNRTVLRPMKLAAVAGAGMSLTWSLAAVGCAAWVAKGLGLAAFFAIYAAGVLRMRAEGLLSGPRTDS